MTRPEPFEIKIDPKSADADGKVLETRFSTNTFDPVEAIKQVLAGVRGIASLRLLQRPMATKLFIILDDEDLDRDYEIVKRMVQLDDIKPTLDLSYDLLPSDAAHFVPAEATQI
jgi:hypothetical protein